MSVEVGIKAAAKALGIKGDDFTRHDIAKECRSHDLERTGLAADHITVTELADGQRLDAVFVAARIDPVLGHDDESETSFHHVERLYDIHDTVLVGVLLDKMGEEFAVGIGLEDGSMFLEITGYLLGVHKVAIAGYGEVTGLMMKEYKNVLLGIIDNISLDGVDVILNRKLLEE